MRFGPFARVVLFLLLAVLASACSTSTAPSPYSPSPGPGAFGQPCSETEDCASLLCVRVDASGGVCTRACESDQDCPAAVNWRCLQPSDVSHPICACRRDPSQSCLNGVDNDCNGVVDECQTCDGVSVSVNDPNNCGGCGIVCGSEQRCTSGRCECSAPGMTACGNACVDTQNDADNCGTCGNACASGQTCVHGACACSDPSRPNACGTLCTSFATDNGNCGSCGTQCQGGSSCSGGTCQCPAATATNCGGTCVDTGSDANNCGACGMKCNTGQSCVNGACRCDPSAPQLCGNVCVDPSTDANNCGGCGIACVSIQSCVGGVCTCPSSDPTLCSGFCTNTSTDVSNCGACGQTCGASQVCQGGACHCSDSRLTICSGTCVDTFSDAANCGTCGHACGAGEMCSGGTCNCASGVYCGTACEPVDDSLNCGACGNVCGAGQYCSGGACACSPGLTSCSGSCVDEKTDVADCGSCGKACLATEVCANGACACPQAGQAWCASKGACTSLYTDHDNCGACGHACPASASCSGGGCVCTTVGQTACGTACVNLQTDVANCGSCGTTCAGHEQCTAGVCGCGNPTVGTPMDLAAGNANKSGGPAVGGFGWDGTHIGLAFERTIQTSGAYPVPSGSLWFALLNPDGSRAVADQLLRQFTANSVDALMPASVAFNGTQWAAFWLNESYPTTNMLVQRFASDGTAIGSQVDITPALPASTYAFALRVVWSQPAGTYVAVYETRNNSTYATAIVVQPLGADGTQPGTAVTINTTQDLVDVAVAPTGDVGVLQNAVGTSLVLTVVDATGKRLQGDATFGGTSASYGALVHDGTAWIAAWATQSPRDVVVHRVAAGASDLVIAQPPSDYVASVGLLWSGSTGAVTWREPNGAMSTTDLVFLERFDVNGSSPVALTGPMQLATPATSQNIVLDQTVLMPTGVSTFLAGWTDYYTFPVATVDVSACP